MGTLARILFWFQIFILKINDIKFYSVAQIMIQGIKPKIIKKKDVTEMHCHQSFATCMQKEVKANSDLLI